MKIYTPEMLMIGFSYAVPEATILLNVLDYSWESYGKNPMILNANCLTVLYLYEFHDISNICLQYKVCLKLFSVKSVLHK